MTISFFVLSETLTMILCKMSQDTGGNYQQTFCRNLSGLIIVIYITWPFHFIGFVCCMIQTCMEGNRGSQLLNTWVTSTYGWVLRVFSVPLRTEWWPQVTEAGLPGMCHSLPATATRPSRTEVSISLVSQKALWVPWLQWGAHVGISCCSDKANVWIPRELFSLW